MIYEIIANGAKKSFEQRGGYEWRLRLTCILQLDINESYLVWFAKNWYPLCIWSTRQFELKNQIQSLLKLNLQVFLRYLNENLKRLKLLRGRNRVLYVSYIVNLFSRQQNETDLHLVKTLHYNSEETKDDFLFDADPATWTMLVTFYSVANI